MSNPAKTNVVKVRPVDEDFDGAVEQDIKSEAAPEIKPEAPKAAIVPPKPVKKRRSRFMLLLLAAAALGAGGWYGYNWWTDGRFLISTDDAYVEGDIANIAPKVTGYVAEVNVKANQRVKAGDPLVTLDNGDYQIAVSQAEAQIATQKLTLNRFDAQIEAAVASVAQAKAQKTALEATLHGAKLAEDRASQLRAKAVGTQADLDNARVALDQAQANLAGADANIAAASASIDVDKAQRQESESSIRSLELQLTKAKRDLSFTVLKAPFDGVVGNLAVQPGDFIAPGQRLAALVPVKELYIEANFKETQVAAIVPGSTVRIHVDALGKDAIEGKVLSVSPASGSVFSLLPAENATGNFTKVTQRIPVRIAVPESVLEKGKLRAGLSVVVDVDTRTAPKASN
jgi:membrane fusion protein (multidrug efflux system)